MTRGSNEFLFIVIYIFDIDVRWSSLKHLYKIEHTFIVILCILDGPGSSILFNPADESITKVLGQSLGPIVCSAQCNPLCQFYWIKPDGSVVAGSNLSIPIMSKNDHGTFKCHTGNGYGNNATKNLNVTVNCKYLIRYMIIYFKLSLTYNKATGT